MCSSCYSSARTSRSPEARAGSLCPGQAGAAAPGGCARLLSDRQKAVAGWTALPKKQFLFAPDQKYVRAPTSEQCAPFLFRPIPLGSAPLGSSCSRPPPPEAPPAEAPRGPRRPPRGRRPAPRRWSRCGTPPGLRLAETRCSRTRAALFKRKLGDGKFFFCAWKHLQQTITGQQNTRLVCVLQQN